MFDKTYILSYESCKNILFQRLKEPAPSRIQLLVGPRQVGKTTLLLEIAKRLGGVAFYVALDSPESALPGFWERFWSRIHEAVRKGETVYALLDEIQTFPHWASLLKGEVDRILKECLPVHVVATGSSMLQIGFQSRESLAGRFERMTLTHWTLSTFTQVFHLKQSEALELFIQRGAYPGAFRYIHDIPRWRAYLRDAIVEPAIGRDIIALASIRKPALLRQIFAICTTTPAQIISLQKIVGQLQESGSAETVAHYLSVLEDAFLIASLPKYAATEIRSRASPPKIISLSNALLAATGEEAPPSAQNDPKRFGAWVENACLAMAWNGGQSVKYWREEPLEVEAIIEGSWGKWAIEVKTGRFSSAELRGLFEFCKRYPSFRPLLLCNEEDVYQAERFQITAQPWPQFLLSGPP